MRHHYTNPLFFVVGLVIIFFALIVFRAALRNMGRGDCLTGCCLWELSDSLMDIGCGLIGCGGAMAMVALGWIAWTAWPHK